MKDDGRGGAPPPHPDGAYPGSLALLDTVPEGQCEAAGSKQDFAEKLACCSAPEGGLALMAHRNDGEGSGDYRILHSSMT
jgi:hypothetical protein